MRGYSTCQKCGELNPLTAAEILPDGNMVILCSRCGTRTKIIKEEPVANNKSKWDVVNRIYNLIYGNRSS